MHPLRSLGWGLLVSAFLAAGAESAAQVMEKQWGFMPAADVLRVLYPHVLSALHDAIAPVLWDYVVLPLLAFPGWVLFGAPGAFLVWHYRPHPDHSADEDEQLPQTTYEQIVESARQADEQDIGLPSKYRDLDEYDPTHPPTDENAEAHVEPYDLERADIVPPARHLSPPFSGGSRGGKA